MAGDPIVTRERTAIKKMPQMVLEISGGWFVKTHSSTYTKMSFLRKIAVALKVDLKFELFRKEPCRNQSRRGVADGRASRSRAIQIASRSDVSSSTSFPRCSRQVL